jgi:trk system potassium uptake protein TrkA
MQGRLRRVKAIIVGCGRVGAAVALQLHSQDWDVTVVDLDEEALARLDQWRGKFVVGHGLDAEVLERAGIADADAVVVATNGDNTNIVIGQVAQRRYGVARVVARVLDPRRADFYAERGLRTICPTKTAIAAINDSVVLGTKGSS